MAAYGPCNRNPCWGWCWRAAAAAAGAAAAAAAGDDDRGYFVAAKAACYGAICVGCLETLIIVFIVANAIIICVADVGYERERERETATLANS